MSIIDALGFRAYTAPAKRFTSVLVTSGGTFTIGSFGPGSTAGLRFASNEGSANRDDYVRRALPSNQATLFLEFGFKPSKIPSATNEYKIAVFGDSGTHQVRLHLDSLGRLKVVRGDATVLATTSATLSAGVRYWIGWQVTFHNSAGVTKIQINGVEQLNSTGLDTTNTANAYANEYWFGSGNPGPTQNLDNQTQDYDNVLVSTDAFKGEVVVLEDLPTGTGDADDGVATGAADTRQALDDSNPDDDSTYTALENNGDKFLLTFANLPAGVEVLACGTLTYAKKSSSGTAKFKQNLKIGSTEYLSSVEVAPSNGSYDYFVDLQETSPDTSSAFTESEVNGMQVGAERSA